MEQEHFILQNRAESALQLARSYILCKTVKDKYGWGIKQFLDEVNAEIPKIGVYGTACGIITLKACGDNNASHFIQNYRSWLIKQQEDEGGWTPRSLQSKTILTASTCYVLNALHETGDIYSSPNIQDGMQWLQLIQNPGGGWGLYENDRVSKVTPSCHALMAFARYPEMLRTQSASDAIDWLIKSQNRDKGWGQLPILHCSSTIAHTSLSILALLSAGYSAYSDIVMKPLDLLQSQLQTSSWRTEIEIFYGAESDESELQSTWVRHYHLPSASLALRALLVAGVDPLENVISNLAEYLIYQQNEDGYWLDETTPGKIPIWAMMYNCLALREYNIRIDAIRQTITMRQSIIELTKSSCEERLQLQEISNRLSSLENQIMPISKTLQFIRKYRLFIALMLAVSIYVYISLTIKISEVVNIVGIIFAAFTTLLGIYDSRQNSKS